MSREVTIAETALLAASNALSGKYGPDVHERAVKLVKIALAEYGWCSVADMDPEELKELLGNSGLRTVPVAKQ